MTDQDKPPTPTKRTIRKEAKDKKPEAAAEPMATLPAASIDALAGAIASIESAKAETAPATATAEVRPLQPAAASAAQAALQAAVEGSLQIAAKAAAPEIRPAAPVRAADKKTVGRLAAFRTTTLPRLTRYAAYGLALTIAVTAGWAGNKYLANDRGGASALAFSIGQSQAETRRIAEDLRALKESVAGLNKGAVRSVQAPAPSEDLKAMKASLAALNEGLERLKQDTSGRLTQLTTQLDRFEKSGGDTAKITPLVDRLDRIERQTATFATLVTGSISQQSPASQAQEQAQPRSQPQGQTQAQIQVAKAEEAKPDPKQQRLDGFVLREIFDGVALVETRRGIIEVAPGQNIAGIGRIEKFERRGRQWVVVTDKGFIPSAQ
jgi:hypothetical protein